MFVKRIASIFGDLALYAGFALFAAYAFVLLATNEIVQGFLLKHGLDLGIWLIAASVVLLGVCKRLPSQLSAIQMQTAVVFLFGWFLFLAAGVLLVLADSLPMIPVAGVFYTTLFVSGLMVMTISYLWWRIFS